jgi:hypothetical protein
MSNIIAATWADKHGNKVTVKIDLADHGRVWACNQYSGQECLSNAYRGYHSKGNAGQRAEIKKAVKNCKTDQELATALCAFGFPFVAGK